MPLEPITIRFHPLALAAARREAEVMGISLADFTRDAVLFLTAFSYLRRGGEGVDELEAVFEKIREFDHAYGPFDDD